MPRSYLHVKPSRKSHVRRILETEVGRGYLVAVTSSDMACHVHPVTATADPVIATYMYM